MRYLWLLLLIACGSVQFPGVLTLPEALPAKSSSAAGGGNGGGAGGGVTAPSAGDTSADYDDSGEEEEQRAPGNLAKSTAGPKFPDPYFEQTDVIIYVPKNATSVKLECPVKNYNAQHHVIMWYKDDVPVSNDRAIINKIYALDEQFGLTVPLAANATEERFVCKALPNALRQVTIRFGPEPSTPAPAADPAVTSAPAKDSAPQGRDISLWLVSFLLASVQLAVVSLRF
ncbi:uncharacterized protein LOC108096867 [Drosophila ficusphila]|uniref:uncharacterized protein LOC108096867 n=1 Tax=Drosophila ficusphila TaxID=30025 RepID=UPI0007E81786|nr:uncharacterized protein LOC108096867 [Drosophila ficusphila]